MRRPLVAGDSSDGLLEGRPPLGPDLPIAPSARGLARARAILLTALPKGAVVLSVLTFGGYAMGLLRDRMLAHTFGAGPELDAYNAVFRLPDLTLNILVMGGLIGPFLPLFVGLKGEDAAKARAFGRTVLTLSVAAMGIASAVLFVLAPQTLSIVAPGFQGDQRDLYVGLFRATCVTPIIFAASILLGEILVAERRFVTYGLADLMYNGGIVAGTFVLADRIGIYAAAVGAVAGALGHLGIRLVGIYRTSFRPRPSLALRTAGLGEFTRLMLPKMVSQPLQPLSLLYFTALASRLDSGSVTSYAFALNFQGLPVSLIGMSFAVAAFPALSSAAAGGDRGAFRRTFGVNLATIALLSTGAAVGLLVVGGLAIRVLLGGGAFDAEDVARTTLVLSVFTVSIPLESMTELFARGLYATRNTVLPTAAAIAGFTASVVAAEALAPGLGLVAIPAAYSIGMAVKLAIVALALVPRMARIGVVSGAALTPGGERRPRAAAGIRVAPERPRDAVRGDLEGPGARVHGPRLVLRRAALALAVVGLLTTTAYAAGEAVRGSSLAVDPVVTPWAREHAAVAAAPSVATMPVMSSGPAASSSLAGGPIASVAATVSPSPTPKPGPFSMDLYKKGDFVGEAEDTWCVPAAMQTSMNIMDSQPDVSRATQQKLFNLATSIVPGRNGGAEPEGWATGLAALGYGNFEVAAEPTMAAALHRVVSQIRLQNRPAGLVVWKGWHSWVVSGFTATADPAVTDDFTVTALRVEDVWYNRRSSIWSKSRNGYSRPPDSLVAVAALPEDYLPWHQAHNYPGKEGNYVFIVPVE